MFSIYYFANFLTDLILMYLINNLYNKCKNKRIKTNIPKNSSFCILIFSFV